MEARYYVVDVFTDQRFAGNPLAVFPHAEGIPESLLPRIAAELNLSETAFVYPGSSPTADVASRRVRIFTPAEELPFAGHPTIGTGWLLATLGELKLRDGRAAAVLEEGVGPIPIAIEELENGQLRVSCTAAKRPTLVAPAAPPELLARALGVSVSDLSDDVAGSWSAGVPFVVVGLRDLAALGAIRIDPSALAEVLELGQAGGIYVVVLGPSQPGGGAATVRCRMFAPGLGVPEDAATGSAALAFAGALVGHGHLTADGRHQVAIEQGIEMGRPSHLELTVDLAGGQIEVVQLSGSAVLVAAGAMKLS